MEDDPKPSSISPAAKDEDAHVLGHAINCITQLLDHIQSWQKELGPRQWSGLAFMVVNQGRHVVPR